MRARAGRGTFRRAIAFSTLTVLLLTAAVAVFAHVDGDHRRVYSLNVAYFEFLVGFEATLNRVPVLLLMIVTGLMIGLRPADTLQRIWPVVPTGLTVGCTIGTFVWIPAITPAYGAVIMAGLLIAASPEIGIRTLCVIVIALTSLMPNSMLSGYYWWEIPPFVYLGVAMASVLGMSVVYLIVRLSMAWLPDRWISIAWRALASWVVAIAILMIALQFADKG